MRILCASDIHIGRRPFVLSSGITGATSAAAWNILVDFAVESKVDVVAIAGDIIDRGNRYFEAIGLLENGLSRLATAGITTVAIAGNHDCEVLQRLVDTVSPKQFVFLGRGGKWESCIVESGNEAVRFVGWSFPTERPSFAPLTCFNMETDVDIPTVGLMHGDIDTPVSRYATMARADLQRYPVNAWVLGHLHTPRRFGTDYGRSTFYCGSLQGLDPSESGERGAWLLEIGSAKDDILTFVPLAPLRFETLNVDLTSVENDAEGMGFQQCIYGAIDAFVQSLSAAKGRPATDVSLRIRLRGRTQVYKHMTTYRKRFDEEDQSIIRGDATYHIEKLIDNTAPAIDLEDLARASDPPGVLARLLIACETGVSDGPLPQLVRRARPGVLSVHDHAKFQSLHESRTFNQPVNDELARDAIRKEAYRLLETLMDGRANQ